jgi:hypothetical protein
MSHDNQHDDDGSRRFSEASDAAIEAVKILNNGGSLTTVRSDIVTAR